MFMDLVKTGWLKGQLTCHYRPLASFYNVRAKTAFQIGFLLFLPFLVIDMVVARC